MLGILHKIQKKYGWEVYKKLFRKCVEMDKQNKYPKLGEDKIKSDFLVKELSLAAGVNFYSYFKNWGFPVSEEINNALKHLPKPNFIGKGN